MEREAEHRPWPLPEEPWLLAQTWDDLLFIHYRVDPEEIARFVPQGLEVDQHEGSAWASVTPFVITGFRLRGAFPVPFFSTFAELNVRTYVTAEERPGIWFFSLDASSRWAVEAARRKYKLPYFHARMSVEQRGADVAYSCSRAGGPDRRFEGRCRPAGGAFNAEPGSLDWFLAERYCLYTADRGRLHRAEIHHPLWPLQEAEAVVQENTMPPLDLSLGPSGPSRFSRRQDVLVWPLRPLAP